jgi:hypothetical protein
MSVTLTSYPSVDVAAARSPHAPAWLRRWLWKAGVPFLVWTALAVLSIIQVKLAMSSRGRDIPWMEIVPSRLLDWYTCALFTPVLMFLVRRRPLEASGWVRAMPLYLAVTSACVVLKYVIMVAVINGVSSSDQMTLATALSQNFVLELMIFWGVVAVLHAADSQRRLVQRDHLELTLRAQLSEARLAALTGQLQPHFLFNTLNGVASLIHTAPATADFIVVQLADLLRASLQHGRAQQITLADELALLDKYLAIMQARFGGRVRVERDIAPDVMRGLVPQFLLQPLVENAFEHGIGRRAAAGTITLRILRLPTGRLRLEVRDDGEAPLAALVREHVGLGNSRRRLAHLYGDDQSFTLTSAPGGGTMAAVELPYHES